MQQPIGKYRWVVVTLLFFATTVNYLDRQVIGLLKDNLAKDFHWSEKDYSDIVMAFTAAYALGLLGFGRLIDRIGTKLGYTLSIIIWSVAAMLHALATGTFSFGLARSALGLGEGGNFPAAIKVVAEWFPRKERALATGIFNSGSNIAAVVGPPVIAWIFSSYGWKEAFIWTGALGFIWLIFWWWLYDIPSKQKRLSSAEFEYIHSDEPDIERQPYAKAGWKRLFSVRQTWAFIFGKFLTDPVWWFYLFWIPSYFNTTYHLNLQSSAVYVSTVYVMASFGSILGGYLSGWLIIRGMPVYKARKTAMLLFAICVVPVFFVRYATHIWPAVWLISLAAAAHQAWSATIFTTASDMFPKRVVSSVVGIGVRLDHFKLLGMLNTGYNIIFLICSSAYLIAWVVMHLLAPRMNFVDN